MKNILITSDCFVKGEPVEKGTILEGVDNSTSAALLTSGRATLAPRAPKAEKPKPTKEPNKKAAKKSPKKKAAKSDES
jgi:hypothetical protein